MTTPRLIDRSLDRDSREWIESLTARGADREKAVARLHALLLRASRFEAARRGASLPELSRTELEEIALQSANDALVAVLAKLDSFAGRSRFTTWAYKFALLETAVKLRRRPWQSREIPLDDERWPEIPTEDADPVATLEQTELLAALRDAVNSELSDYQREILVAVALNGVPIDVLAERRGTTRGAIYKTLHDGRAKLRRRLEADGHMLGRLPTGATP